MGGPEPQWLIGTYFYAFVFDRELAKAVLGIGTSIFTLNSIFKIFFFGRKKKIDYLTFLEGDQKPLKPLIGTQQKKAVQILLDHPPLIILIRFYLFHYI